jgi:5-oxoprolinase (ATP-hydrolysing)/N-methylhydantoinase A
MSDLKRYRIGLDIGGTFTDFVLLDNERAAIRLHKCLTTPTDPSAGALEGLGELLGAAGLTLADIGEIVHGTTLVTNALIERKGARLGLVTTAGFRDLLDMGTEQRYDIYDLFLRYPDPLVPRRRRLEVAERMDRDGSVVIPLDLDGVRRAAQSLVQDGVEAIAVGFLHAYRNPAHEQAAGAAICALYPDLTVSLSSEVVAELWEYQRIATTCANAFVQPLMDRYVARLKRELWQRGFCGQLYLMHSAGGLIAPDIARALPIRLLESGPAGGALATAYFGKLAGKPDVISFDMGGTTAKACIIVKGRAAVAAEMEAARVHRFKKGSGLPVKAPVIDMIEIGAGGGSIGSIDEVGLLRVGPHSAGADPGPACYGRGGTEATVTDANLVLGYYDRDFFLGGRMALDQAAAEQALGKLGAQISLSAIDTASGIHRLVTESMAAAARIHIVEKGADPRAYAIVAFGGAGPAHAAGVARILGVKEVIVPLASGAASALGFLAAPLSFEQVQSYPLRLDDADAAERIDAVVARLETEVAARITGAGIPAEHITTERSADMRLFGQLHEINVALPQDRIDAVALARLRADFARAYAGRYTAVYEGVPIQLVSIRVRCLGPEPKLAITPAAPSDGAASRKGARRAFFDGDFIETPVYDRYALREGMQIAGPAIVEEREATTVVAPGDRLTVDATGSLRLAIAVAAPAAARITPAMPLAEARALIEADPVSLEIMWARLVTVVEEMWHTVVRTAFSLIISEAQDFACDLLDPDGESLAHSPRAMPVFNLTVPIAVKALLQKFPPETLRPGDVLITNDPWLCAGHLFDIAVVTPVFRGDHLVALTATVGNVSDIGGTKDSLRAREIYDEGFQIPPMKLYRAGVLNEDLMTLLGENVRKSADVLGDLHSFVAANQLGAERLLAVMADYGMHDLRALAAVIQKCSEDSMREAIRALPDGVFGSEIFNNPLGTRLRYPVEVTVRGDTVAVDFAGAPPQQPVGGLNCTYTYSAAHTTYALKCVLSPQTRSNAGCYRPFTVLAPAGSILNCDKPAAVNLRTRTGWYIAPNIFRALAAAAPDQVQAATGLPHAVNIYGRDADGRVYSDHFFMGGGQGASAHGDGKSALLYPTSAANTSIELLETRVPVLVLEKTLVTDSGGAGRLRGGLGTRTSLRKLYDDGLPTQFSIYPEGVGIATEGLCGGRAGGGARGVVRDENGAVVHDCGTGELVTLSSIDRVVEVQLSGGSGYGRPRDRPRSRLADDVADGYVSMEASERDYGGGKAVRAAE